MNQLTILCLASVLFAVLIPFSISFPSPDENAPPAPIPSDPNPNVQPVPIPNTYGADPNANVQPAPIPNVQPAPISNVQPAPIQNTNVADPNQPNQIQNANNAVPDQSAQTTGIQSINNVVPGTQSGGQLSCGTCLCPPGSIGCLYVEQTTENGQFLVRNSTCTGENGQILYNNSDKVPNDPQNSHFSKAVSSMNADINQMFDNIWKNFGSFGPLGMPFRSGPYATPFSPRPFGRLFDYYRK